MGMPGLEPGVFGGLRGCQFVLTGRAGGGPAPPNLRRLDGAGLAAARLSYMDLVGAVDVVVTKRGYGIVTDCIGAGTRLVYTERGDFPEYPVMVEEMPRYLPAVFASNEDVREGRLGPAHRGRPLAPVPGSAPHRRRRGHGREAPGTAVLPRSDVRAGRRGIRVPADPSGPV